MTNAAAGFNRGAREHGGVAGSVRAQQSLVGYFYGDSPEPFANQVAAFRKGLREEPSPDMIVSADEILVASHYA
jgi:hypothetical protein